MIILCPNCLASDQRRRIRQALPRWNYLILSKAFFLSIESQRRKWWVWLSRVNLKIHHINSTSFRGPASRQGNKKLGYRLIRLFSSTEIFSKRRKICALWRKTRVNSQWVNLAVCRRWLANASGVCIYHLRACALNYKIYKKLYEAQNFHTTTGPV